MSFLWPAMLLSLLLIPLFIGIYLRNGQRRRQIALDFGNLGKVQGTGKRLHGWRRHLPAAFFLTGLAILMFAMARPHATVSLPKLAGTLILAFDVSGSMAANDMEPTRMEAAKAAVADFIQQQPLSVQTGVVAFSDNGFSVQAPTNDKEAILAAIDRLVGRGGTEGPSGGRIPRG